VSYGINEMKENTKNMNGPQPTYLGDAVYAQFECGDLVLTTGSHQRSDSSNTIYLEPKIVDSLLKYIEHVKLFKQQENRND